MSEQPDPNQYPDPNEAVYASRADIQEAFHVAERESYGLGVEDEFRTMCLAGKIDADDPSNPDYWRTMAMYGYEVAAADREANGPSMHADAAELLAVAPAFVIEQAALYTNRFNSQAERQAARQTASYFNGLVRSFAYNYPEVHASDMLGSLNKIIGRSVEDKAVRQVASTELKSAIRGAQHELAFGQLLSAAGIEYWAADIEQDLSGIDYIIKDAKGLALAVDVKASLSEIEARGSEKLYCVKKNGRESRVLIYSMIRDDELKDTFWLPDEVAQQKAPVLKAQLAQAAKAA